MSALFIPEKTIWGQIKGISSSRGLTWHYIKEVPAYTLILSANPCLNHYHKIPHQSPLDWDRQSWRQGPTLSPFTWQSNKVVLFYFAWNSKIQYSTGIQSLSFWYHLELNMSSSKLQDLVMVREAWRAAVHGVAKSWTRLRDGTELRVQSIQFNLLIMCIKHVKIHFWKGRHLPSLSLPGTIMLTSYSLYKLDMHPIKHFQIICI